jgi:hypothetical protein
VGKKEDRTMERGGSDEKSNGNAVNKEKNWRLQKNNIENENQNT